jgi:protein N-terminal amidase
MKAACLQFAPELGKLLENMAKADKLLDCHKNELTSGGGHQVWLVLPEMAFSGIHFS